MTFVPGVMGDGGDTLIGWTLLAGVVGALVILATRPLGPGMRRYVNVAALVLGLGLLLWTITPRFMSAPLAPEARYGPWVGAVAAALILAAGLASALVTGRRRLDGSSRR